MSEELAMESCKFELYDIYNLKEFLGVFSEKLNNMIGPEYNGFYVDYNEKFKNVGCIRNIDFGMDKMYNTINHTPFFIPGSLMDESISKEYKNMKIDERTENIFYNESIKNKCKKK